jgi:hypothetical protein
MRAVRNTKRCAKHKRTLCTNEGPAQKLPDAAPCGAQFNDLPTRVARAADTAKATTADSTIARRTIVAAVDAALASGHAILAVAGTRRRG